MKEATGELSTTVIAIVAIAAILAVFTAFLLPTLRAQIAMTQACNSGPGTKINEPGKYTIDCPGSAGADTWTCTYTSEDGGQVSSKECKK